MKMKELKNSHSVLVLCFMKAITALTATLRQINKLLISPFMFLSRSVSLCVFYYCNVFSLVAFLLRPDNEPSTEAIRENNML